MGLPIDPPIYGDDCLTCFAAGKTPEHMWLTFADIQIGNLWWAAFPPPPSGPYLLTQTGNPCIWFLNDPPFLFQFAVAIGPFHITGSVVGGGAHFFSDAVIDNCLYNGENQLNNPIGHVYYGGTAQVGFSPPGSSPSLTDAAALVGLTPDDEVKCNISHEFPDWTAQIISHQIPTNIYIKQEP